MNRLKDVPLYLLLFHSLAALATEVNPEEMFRFPSRTNNIAVSASGKVFVATENFLYQLNQRLGLEVCERTGPLLEGPCTEQLGCCAKWKETANVNKILVVDDKKQRVLTCGTVRLGACKVRELHNISRYQNDSLKNVASLHPEASTIAFLVNGPMKTYLVTAVTPTGKSSRFIPDTCKGNRTYYEGNGATIFLRNPEGRVGDPTFLGFNDGAHGDAVVSPQDNYPVELQYVQGFQWQSHIYILLNANTSGPEIICMDIKDRRTSTLQSFAQATLFCPWRGGQAIRVLSSALIHPSHSPAFMAAILSQQGHPENTALYFYNLSQFNEYRKCHKVYFMVKNEEVCNEFLYPINNISMFNHSGLLSVSARIVRDWIVLFLGTDDGQLIKLVIDGNMKLIHPTVLFELKEETPIHHRVMFDKLDSNHLYLTSETEVRRLKVAPCDQYISCTDCLSALDPFCGWCTLKKRCSFENECENSNHTVHWITMAEQNSCPRVTFTPSAIDYSLNSAKLFKIEVTEKLRTLIKENAICTMRKARNKEVICIGKYTNANDCPCRLSNNIYTQLENEPDPIIIEASVEFSSLKFSTNVTVHNCYKIATVRLNNVPCSECIKSGCHWCVAEHKCTHTPCNQTAEQFCPQVDKATLHPTKDLRIFLKHAKVLNDSNIRLNCKFNGQLLVANWIDSSTIHCLQPQFKDERRIIPVNVVHATNSTDVIDNPNNITVYSCDTQKPDCVFCTSERICTESVVTKIYPVRVSSSGTTTLTIVGSGLNVGLKAVLYIRGMSDHITVKTNNCTIENDTLVRCILPKTTHGKKTVCLLYDSESQFMSNRTAVLEYTSQSFITKIHPTVLWASGGRNITINGKNLDVIKQVQMWLSEDPNKWTECSVNNRTWICVAPSLESRRIPGNHSMSFLVSGSKKQDFPLTYHHDPVFYNFTKIIDDKQLLITVLKKKDNLCLQREEVKIYVPRDKGDPLECNITEITEDKIKCLLLTSDTPVPKIEVTVGPYKAVLTKPVPSKLIFIVLIVIPVMLVIFISIYCWATSRKAKQFSQSLNSQMELLESQFRNQIREGFVELQTEGSDMQLLEDSGSIPFLDYKHFAVRTFFPESGNGASVPSFVSDPIVTAPQAPGKDKPNEGFDTLTNFLSNEQFLVTLIHILEQQKDFSIKDRCRFASFLTIAFHSNLVYLTRILDRLLKDLMDQSTAQPKLLLRGTETVVEKLLTNWVSLCMYGFLRESVGEPLFKLVSAIKQRINLGPVDAISGKALYTLNEDWLLWQVTDFNTLKLNVIFQLSTEVEYGSDLDLSCPLEVDVLDCDTIGQAKEKIFETFFNKYGYSQRFQMKDIDLELIKNGPNQILQDIDQTSQVLENGMTKLNTIGHYRIPAAASIVAIKRVNSSKIDGESENKLCHLISPHSEFVENPVPEQGKQKFKVKEMYLTKLLSSKVALHSFVETLFRSIWSIPNNKPPMAIRHVFDILQAQAYNKKLTDPDVLHIWKTNSLPLRFWINIIKNPQFVFDIEKTPHLDSCLSVIAQAFMDSFSLSSHQLGKHSPTNKVLYARDIPHYKDEVKHYYRQIADMASLTEEEMEKFLTEESKKHENEFKEKDAMVELGKYIQKYSVQLESKLENEGIQEMNEGISKIREFFDRRSKCGWE
ncbi:plexin-C1 isoform X2 [Heptranchias perlo]|uniref:plexin-C1 isoform X2 n=1 Tax=Heptranchias perlo TaxID=212740 RepID=UPI00355955A2